MHMIVIDSVLLLAVLGITLLRPTWGLYAYVLLIPGLSLAGIKVPPVGTLSGAITLAIVIVLVIHALMGTLKLRVSPITWPFLVFIGANLVALLQSGEGLTSLVLVVYYFVLHLLVYNAIPSKESAQRLLFLLALVTVILSALGISSYIVGWPPWEATAMFPTEFGWVVRLQGPAADPNAFAYIFLLGLPLVTAQAFLARGWLGRLLWTGGLGVGLAGLILTFSRSAYIGFAVSCIVLFWAAERKMKWRYLRLAALAVVVLVILFPGPWKVWMAERITSAGQLSGDVARVQQFQGAWLTFLDHPFLGVGLGRAQEAVLHYIPNAIAPYPHNNILMTSVEMGLLGLVPLLVIFYCAIALILRAAFRSKGASRNRLAAVAAAIIGYLVQGLFIFNLHWGLFWWITGVALAIAMFPQNNFPIKAYRKGDRSAKGMQ